MNGDKKLLLLFLLVLALCAALHFYLERRAAGQSHKSELFALDTYIEMTACGENAPQALELAEKRLAQLEAELSVTLPGSDIYEANSSARSAREPVSYELRPAAADALRQALHWAEVSGGAFDPTLCGLQQAWNFTGEQPRISEPQEIAALLEHSGYAKLRLSGRRLLLPPQMQLDLGGIGKGWIGDELLRLFKEQGVGSAVISLGGNVQALGARPDGSPWRIGLRDPNGGSLGVLALRDKAAVTSGDYERFFMLDGRRYSHILDPRTGRPADSGLRSVTVVGGSTEGAACDALATACCVLGLEGSIRLWRERLQQLGFGLLLVTADREIYLTEDLASCLTLTPRQTRPALHLI